ncbi:MAG: ferrous iron transport protein B [Oscillospiraceae bacterium]|jgi:ferrous iron transport protein B|nr:ferrous iron transport protein B [Oscillospiraceae bacterium]
MRIALAGNPNSGKTTMFNNLTGAKQYVGNWPGVTVEKKEGRLRRDSDVVITDLPGIYSLSPYTVEEVISRNYIIDDQPDAVINIVDASNIERNLYLTTQLLEINIPVVIALNMMDIAAKNKTALDTGKLSAALGCPVVETVALKGLGSSAAAEEAVKISREKHVQSKVRFSPQTEDLIAEISGFIRDRVEEGKIRYYAIKLFERDSKINMILDLPEDIKRKIEVLISAAEKKADDDSESIITNERYNFIEKVVAQSVKKPSNFLTVSDKIDKIITHRVLALPIFVAVMALIYFIAVSSVGQVITDFTNEVLFGEWIQPGVAALLESAGAAPWIISLVVDGIIGGIGAPIGFVPQMALLFLLLSALEDCGYMARVAFIMDRVFRHFGLSGKSFIPLLISSGCGVPAIMACRTIENEKDRRITMMTATFIPCGAKLPVIALMAGSLLGGAWWLSLLMYFLGIIFVIISGLILKRFKNFAGKPSPFVMELPQYHAPVLRNLLLTAWERVLAFLKKAGTVIFLCSAAMWLLSSFGFVDGAFRLLDPEEVGSSVMAAIGGFIAPIFVPLGFGTWQAVASTLSGFIAKESIVSTMAILTGMAGLAEGDVSLWSAVAGMFPTMAGAFCFLMFNLYDSPCVAAIVTLAREMSDRKLTAFALVYQNMFSYCAALVVYQLTQLFTGGSFGLGTVAAFAILAAFVFLLSGGRKKIQTVKG